MEKVRYKEELLESMSRKNRVYGGRQSTQFSTLLLVLQEINPLGYVQKEGSHHASISGTKLFEARKTRRECYKCGEKYFPGHVCKSKLLNALSGTTDHE